MDPCEIDLDENLHTQVMCEQLVDKHLLKPVPRYEKLVYNHSGFPWHDPQVDLSPMHEVLGRKRDLHIQRHDHRRAESLMERKGFRTCPQVERLF